MELSNAWHSGTWELGGGYCVNMSFSSLLPCRTQAGAFAALPFPLPPSQMCTIWDPDHWSGLEVVIPSIKSPSMHSIPLQLSLVHKAVLVGPTDSERKPYTPGLGSSFSFTLSYGRYSPMTKGGGWSGCWPVLKIRLRLAIVVHAHNPSCLGKYQFLARCRLGESLFEVCWG
jgi:hypothetical protein